MSELIASIIGTFEQASPYLLLGLFVSGLMRAYVHPERIARHLGQGRIKPVLWAAAVGIPLPLCSCGVIPAAMALRKNGATKGATVSFLISTPETGIDSLALSWALLDPLLTFARPIAALISALVAGIWVSFSDQEIHQASIPQEVPSCCSNKNSMSNKMGIKAGMHYAFFELMEDIAPWLAIGLVTAGAIGYFLPEDAISRYIGDGFYSMLLMLAVGIPLYVCASASTPIAAALILKGLNPGAALVFLLSGPATNPATILMVTKQLGVKAAIIYVVAISVCALGCGLAVNWIYSHFNIPIQAVLGSACHDMPRAVVLTSSVILAILLVRAIWVKIFND